MRPFYLSSSAEGTAFCRACYTEGGNDVMGKRVLSGLLALLMCVCLGGTVLPQTAKAENALDWEVLWQDDMVFFDEDPWGICCAYENAIQTTRYIDNHGGRTAILHSFDGEKLVPVLEGGFPWHGQSWSRGESIISDDGYFVIYLPEYEKTLWRTTRATLCCLSSIQLPLMRCRKTGGLSG